MSEYVNSLFEILSDSERNNLFQKIIKDEMLPYTLRDPDRTIVARGFWILMTRSKSHDKWASLDNILKTILLNGVTQEEVSITRYVITKYIVSKQSIM
jgi:hypothetical protein